MIAVSLEPLREKANPNICLYRLLRSVLESSQSDERPRSRILAFLMQTMKMVGVQVSVTIHLMFVFGLDC